MAPTNAGSTSSIAMALAGRTASVDIPKPRGSDGVEGRDSFAAVAARSPPVNEKGGKAAANPLPTPPNSISPNLPPLGFKRHRLSRGPVVAAASPPEDAEHGFAPMQVDSDIDLHGEGGDKQRKGSGPRADGSAAVAGDAVGAITPGLLAKHHLPEILLTHGPLAIRHVMGYLTTSVPGFSGIPPAKARRLVVGALEGRGSGGEGGGVRGNVEFEKVGWGRWDARIKGNPTREPHGIRHHRQQQQPQSPPASDPSFLSPDGITISTNRTRWPKPGRSSNAPSSHNYPNQPTSWAGDSAVFSHGSDNSDTDGPLHLYRGDVSAVEDEADKMSLDGADDSCSSSEAPPDYGSNDNNMDEDPGEVTDDEDWANIGAAALRQGSASGPSGLRPKLVNSSHDKKVHSWDHGGAGPGVPPTTNSLFQANGFGSDSAQERDAIEALVKLSSV